MDKKSTEKESRYGWLPLMMPNVAKAMAEKRYRFGDAHVQRCWREGVVNGTPGWFFAREGTLAVGAIDMNDRVACELMLQPLGAGGHVLFVRVPDEQANGGGDGA